MKAFYSPLLLLFSFFLSFCGTNKATPPQNLEICFYPDNNAPIGIKIHFKETTFSAIHYAPSENDPFSGQLKESTDKELVYSTRLYDTPKILRFNPVKKTLHISPPDNEDSLWSSVACEELEAEDERNQSER